MDKYSELYNIIIRYFLIFTSFLFLSGVWLFVISQTDEIDVKSLIGVLEVAVPHLLAMSVVFFVLAHFLLFMENLDRDKAMKFSMLFYLLIILETMSANLFWIKVTILSIMLLGIIWIFYRISLAIYLSRIVR